MTATPTSSTATKPSRDVSGNRVVIKCAGLNKVFKDFWMRPRVRAVSDVNLEIHEGEVFGLLGPNGSGKSTTIKMILGLLHSTSGRIAVLGKRPEDVETKKDIGYLPEESYLYRFLNARETLDYYGRLFHQPRHTRRARIDMLLEMVGLEAAQNRPVGEYSKGMQRRIGIAQALINDPKLLILDEPTTGMDPIGTRQIKDLLIELRKRGKTILLCSHLLADVEDVCDRVSIMFGGKVVANGTLDDLLVDHQTTTLQTENLDDDTIQQIEAVLQKQGKHIDKVSRPRQSLEHKFLELVHQEQEKGSETSGAKAGGKIAGFLVDADRSGHMPEDVEAAALLSQLTTPTTPTPASEATGSDSTGSDESESDSTKPSSLTTSPAPQVPDESDHAVLAELSEPKQPEPVAPKQASSSSSVSGAASDPDVDLSVLDGLVVQSDQPVAAPAPPAPMEAPPVEPAPSAEVETPTDETTGGDDSKSIEAIDAATNAATDAEPDAVTEEVSQELSQQEPPTLLVSERSGESGLNLADAVKVDEEGNEIVEASKPILPDVSESLDASESPDTSEQAEEERVSDSGERPDQSFKDVMKHIDGKGKGKTGGSPSA